MESRRRREGNDRFRHQIEKLYLSLRGRGLMVSPADAAVVAAWDRDGIPLETVTRTVRRTLRPLANRGRVPPLRYCDAAVRRAWGAHKSPGRAPVHAPAPAPARPSTVTVESAAQSAAKIIAAASRKLPRGDRMRAEYAAATESLRELARGARSGEVEGIDSYRVLAAIDRRLCRHFFQGLSPEMQRRARAAAEREARRRGAQRASEAALATLQRELLARELERYGLCRPLGAGPLRDSRRLEVRS